MRFEWDDEKYKFNLLKHRVRFELAARALFDPHAIEDIERDAPGEERWRVLARIDLTTLFIVYTLREDHDETEIIRIISARGATGPEKCRCDAAKNRAV